MASELQFVRTGLFGVQGLVAVITGGGTGIGSVMARGLAQNGATVFILGRRMNKLKSVVEAAASCQMDGRIIPIECDVSSKDSLQAAATKVAEDVGYVNLVIANAGVPGPHDGAINRSVDDEKSPLTLNQVHDHLWKTPEENFTNTFRVNVSAAHFTTVAFLHLLDKGNKQGNIKQTSQIIITSSIGSFHRSWTAASLAYLTSKAAVTHLIKCLAGYLIQFKIRVNGLCPGLFMSEMLASVFGDKDMSVEGSLPKNLQPLTRTGTEKEMAGTVLYLASEAGGYCNGSIQLIDGGRLGVLPGATY